MWLGVTALGCVLRVGVEYYVGRMCMSGLVVWYMGFWIDRLYKEYLDLDTCYRKHHQVRTKPRIARLLPIGGSICSWKNRKQLRKAGNVIVFNGHNFDMVDTYKRTC